jgi:DNA topoisomerase VI subunit B
MIINNQESEVVEILGEVSSKKATINADEVRKLQYILTEGLYKDPVGAVINELCANAVDAVIEAGKDPIENPIRVELGYKNGSYFIEIHDFGIGMSKDFFENSFMSYLTSTKDKNNDAIGAFGLGGKSFAALKRSVNFIITKDGKRCNYLCYKGAEGVEYDLLSETDTDEGNGVLFKMKIDGWNEYEEFKRKAKQKLTYYDTAVLIIDGIPYRNKVYRNELFQFAEESPYSNAHIALKDVVYPIDYNKLNIPSLNLPIAIRFGLNDGLIPTPS